MSVTCWSFCSYQTFSTKTCLPFNGGMASILVCSKYRRWLFGILCRKYGCGKHFPVCFYIRNRLWSNSDSFKQNFTKNDARCPLRNLIEPKKAALRLLFFIGLFLLNVFLKKLHRIDIIRIFVPIWFLAGPKSYFLRNPIAI